MYGCVFSRWHVLWHCSRKVEQSKRKEEGVAETTREREIKRGRGEGRIGGRVIVAKADKGYTTPYIYRERK